MKKRAAATPGLSTGLAAYLVDTSVWIEVSARPARIQLELAAHLEEIVTCLPIMQEVLQGFRDESAFRIARISPLRSHHLGRH